MSCYRTHLINPIREVNMEPKILDPIFIDLDFINIIKDGVGKLFKGRSKYFIVLSESHLVATNVDLADLQTNTKSTSDVYHFVSFKQEAHRDVLRKLLVFNTPELFTYFTRDRFFRHLGHLERLWKYCKKMNMDDGTMLKIFTITPIIYPTGDLDFRYSKELVDFVDNEMADHGVVEFYYDAISSITPNKRKLYMKDKDGAYITNPFNHGDSSKCMCFFKAFNHHRKEIANLELGYTCGVDVTSTITMFYIDHTKAVQETEVVIDPITIPMKEFNKLPFYRHSVTKDVFKLFDNDDWHSIVIPILTGLNHPIPTDKNPHKLEIVLWKENGTVRHNYVFLNDKYHVISFMPQTTFFMYRKEK